MTTRYDAGLLLGRILLSMIFLASGGMKLMDWSGTADGMAAEGMAAVPVFLALAVLCELAGGLSILLGAKARWGALLLAAFLVPVTAIFHDFWTYQGQEMQAQMQHFMKNLTIIGGLLTLAATGAGAYSVDALGAGRQRAELPEVELLRGAKVPHT
jgi:putative oxidoreductase